MLTTRKDLVFFILGGFFLTNALLGELSGGKLFTLPHWHLFGWDLGNLVLSIGHLIWPVVFISTDLVNEYYGKQGVRRLTFLAVGMIAYSFVVLFLAMRVGAWERSPVSDEDFNAVFGQSQWIIVGSLTAFIVSQFVDVAVFWFFRHRTGHRLLWLRATGSTIISQVFDTFLVGFIAFVIPGKLALKEFIPVAVGGYIFKLVVAIVVTPLIYLGHGAIDRFLAAELPALTPTEARVEPDLDGTA